MVGESQSKVISSERVVNTSVVVEVVMLISLLKRKKMLPSVHSLAGLKARLDGALSTLGWWKGSLLMAGGWNQMIFKVPSNPNHSTIP